MTSRLLLVLGAVFLGGCATTAASSTGGYDPALAQRLHADEYGMRKYVMALLLGGPNRDQPKEEAQKIQKAHLANIRRLAQQGVLVLAGPFLDDGEVKGLFVFAVDSVDEARKLTETDPAIQAGRLRMELRPWYGPAALMEVVARNARVERRSISD